MKKTICTICLSLALCLSATAQNATTPENITLKVYKATRNFQPIDEDGNALEYALENAKGKFLFDNQMMQITVTDKGNTYQIDEEDAEPTFWPKNAVQTTEYKATGIPVTLLDEAGQAYLATKDGQCRAIISKLDLNGKEIVDWQEKKHPEMKKRYEGAYCIQFFGDSTMIRTLPLFKVGNYLVPKCWTEPRQGKSRTMQGCEEFSDMYYDKGVFSDNMIYSFDASFDYERNYHTILYLPSERAVYFGENTSDKGDAHLLYPIHNPSKLTLHALYTTADCKIKCTVDWLDGNEYSKGQYAMDDFLTMKEQITRDGSNYKTYCFANNKQDYYTLPANQATLKTFEGSAIPASILDANGQAFFSNESGTYKVSISKLNLNGKRILDYEDKDLDESIMKNIRNSYVMQYETRYETRLYTLIKQGDYLLPPSWNEFTISTYRKPDQINLQSYFSINEPEDIKDGVLSNDLHQGLTNEASLLYINSSKSLYIAGHLLAPATKAAFHAPAKSEEKNEDDIIDGIEL